MKQSAIESILAHDKLKEFLSKSGDVCPYDALRAAINKDPQSDGYGYVMAARRRFESENDCVLECVPNVGIKRLIPREVINRGTRDIQHIRRSTRRGMRRQATLVPVETQKSLSDVEHSEFLARLSYFGILDHLMKPASAKKIATATQAAARILPAGETLELFKPKSVPKETVQ